MRKRENYSVRRKQEFESRKDRFHVFRINGNLAAVTKIFPDVKSADCSNEWFSWEARASFRLPLEMMFVCL